MKLKTSKGELIDLIAESEEESMLLEILANRDVRIASYGWMDNKFTHLCLQFKESKIKTWDDVDFKKVESIETSEGKFTNQDEEECGCDMENRTWCKKHHDEMYDSHQDKKEKPLHGLLPFEGKVIHMNKDSVQDKRVGKMDIHFDVKSCTCQKCQELDNKERICIACKKDCLEYGWCPDCKRCEDCMGDCEKDCNPDKEVGGCREVSRIDGFGIACGELVGEQQHKFLCKKCQVPDKQEIIHCVASGGKESFCGLNQKEIKFSSIGFDVSCKECLEIGQSLLDSKQNKNNSLNQDCLCCKGNCDCEYGCSHNHDTVPDNHAPNHIHRGNRPSGKDESTKDNQRVPISASATDEMSRGQGTPSRNPNNDSPKGI